MGQGQIGVPNKGRWAHDNVKLLHFNFVNRTTRIELWHFSFGKFDFEIAFPLVTIFTGVD